MLGLTHKQLSHNATAMGGAMPFGQANLGELSEGSMGAAVRELQSKLNVLQYGPLDVDGTFGPSTKQALMNFQSTEQLEATGKLDAGTEARLNQRILNVQSAGAGAGAGTAAQAQRSTQFAQADLAPASVPTRPLWQTGLMVLGGIALVGGVIYLLTSESKPDGYQRAMNRPQLKPSWDRAHSKRSRATKYGLRGDGKCPRSPGESAFDEGEPLPAPQEL